MVIRGKVLYVNGNRAIIERKLNNILITCNDPDELRPGSNVIVIGSWYEQRFLTNNLTVETVRALQVNKVVRR